MSSTASAVPSAVWEAAERLRRAAELREPCAPIRDLIAPDDVRAAYAVQSELVAGRLAAGARVVGRKIGLTSPAVQTQLGVDRPDFGVLFDDMACDPEQPVPSQLLLQPKVEAEVAFMLGSDLDQEDIDVAAARAAVAYVVAALEIVDSRIRDWDISFADTVADNASSGLYVLGPERHTLDEVEPADVEMVMYVDGEQVSSGDGSMCLGDPLAALAWLARTAREFGEPLRAGQVILSGALGPMTPLRAGQVVTTEISGLGSVRATIG